MNSPLLTIHDVTIGYGRVEIVHGVSLSVSRGSIVSVIGANGAGKSTLLNAIMGLLPARGSICFDGIEQIGRHTDQRVLSRMSLVPERRELFSTMSVEDNLLLGGFRIKERSEIRNGLQQNFELFPKLAERRRQLAGTLSGGERQMLAMARALMAQPRLLMLDEPSLGLAPLIVGEVFRIIAILRQAGVSILLVEQNARAALEIADYGYVMELGRVTRSGAADELLNDSMIVQSYLGGSVPEEVDAMSQ
jgi:branched-chain amino acid transport system ATP-binding protein